MLESTRIVRHFPTDRTLLLLAIGNDKMRKRVLRAALFSLPLALFISPKASADDYRLYYLGGQSNMDGYGYVKDLPEDLNVELPSVMIFHGNTSPDGQPVDGRGLWTALKPGHGVGFRSDGSENQYSQRYDAHSQGNTQLRPA